jgi:hypothetical protein
VSYVKQSCQSEKKARKSKILKANRSLNRQKVRKYDKKPGVTTINKKRIKGKVSKKIRAVNIKNPQKKRFSSRFMKGKFFGHSKLLGRTLYRNRNFESRKHTNMEEKSKLKFRTFK